MRSIVDSQILEGYVFLMIDEGFKITDERNVIRAFDIDVMWVKG